MYLSPTKGAIAFTRAWRDMLLAPTEDWHMEDQRAFNQMVMTEFYPTVAAPEHARDGAVVLAANRTLRLMPLPAAKLLPRSQRRRWRALGYVARADAEGWLTRVTFSSAVGAADRCF